MAIRFFGPAGSNTGYGNAVTNFAKAFSASGVNTKFMFDSKSSYAQKLLKELNNYTGGTPIDFYLHCPPYNKHNSKASYKIAYFYWEADRLPRFWETSIKTVNELWVPCELVREACLKAKFKGPIKIVPTPCETWEVKGRLEIPSTFSDDYILNDQVYKFYSIFQWQNRKGYDNLLNSYYKTFNEDDNVILILKVNTLNIPGNPGHSENSIKKNILDIKKKLNQKYYPPVYLSTKLVPSSTIQFLHQTGDCYVSPHHGEGWGMPIHDAMKMGNQIVVTKFGGVSEYLDDESAHIIKHSLGPVSRMEWSNLYGSYQNWAYPSSHHLCKIFRDVYENHKEYSQKGLNAQRIANNMTIERVSDIIYQNAKEAYKRLK